MRKCPFCGEEIIRKETTACPFCRGNLPNPEPCSRRSIFHCPLCHAEDSYCDSTNRIFCPHCREYLKRYE